MPGAGSAEGPKSVIPKKTMHHQILPQAPPTAPHLTPTARPSYSGFHSPDARVSSQDRAVSSQDRAVESSSPSCQAVLTGTIQQDSHPNLNLTRVSIPQGAPRPHLDLAKQQTLVKQVAPTSYGGSAQTALSHCFPSLWSPLT